MTIVDLISELKQQQEHLVFTIELLEKSLRNIKSSVTRKSIIKGLRTKSYKYTKSNPHWTQLPKNRKRVIAMAKMRAKNR